MNRTRGLRIALLTSLGFMLAYIVILWIQFNQLEAAFLKIEEFPPTRIYSDVSRVVLGQTRASVLETLRSVSHEPHVSDDSISFVLRNQDFPDYLLPDGHLTAKLGGKSITLEFDGSESSSTLERINTALGEVSDLYLAPVLIATLARGEDGADPTQVRTLLLLEDVPTTVWQAIIATEDQHFLAHKGLDPRGFARAIWINLKTLSFSQGGSTLTQQLVKNLLARRTKNIFKKLNEIFLAMALEAKYDKERILERYLNEVYLGQIGNLEIHGVAEGARYFFGKRLDQLNMGETAFMAGLIRGPGYYSPYKHMDRAVAREKFVLKRMVETGHIAPEEAKLAERLPIRLAPPPTSQNASPYFVDFVKAEMVKKLESQYTEEEIFAAGMRVYTTLDPRFATYAQEAVTQGLSDLEHRLGKPEGIPGLQAALATVDHKMGFVRALVGGRNFSESNFNRILNTKRQVGSTFKPFVYLAALREGVDAHGVPYGGAYPLEDAPLTLTYANNIKSWSPRNYENEFKGWVTMRQALAFSLNTATARLGASVGLPKIIETARALGVESNLPSVPSLILGAAELSPIELLSAYSVIANRGIHDELTVLRGIVKMDGDRYPRFIYNPRQVFEPGPIDLLADLMKSVFSEGTAKSATAWGFSRPAAGKTGTTSNHRDSWFAGFTPEFTTVVWVGIDKGANINDKGQEEIKLTGAGSALPIWVDFMKRALRGKPIMDFDSSSLFEPTRINKFTGLPAESDCSDEFVITENYLFSDADFEETCVDHWPQASEDADNSTE